MKKRGISPIIATILLISLSIVLAMIIFMWARAFLTEQIEKGGKPLEEVCKSVDFEISWQLDPLSDGSSIVLEIVNRGNIPLSGIDVKYFDKNGNTKLNTFDYSADVGESNTGNSIPVITAETEKLIIYPVVMGTIKGKKTNKQVACGEQGKTVTF